MYSAYCSNQAQAIRTIQDMSKNNELFRSFVKTAIRHRRCRALDLAAFMIMPMQRVCKYPLLLKVNISARSIRSTRWPVSISNWWSSPLNSTRNAIPWSGPLRWLVRDVYREAGWGLHKMFRCSCQQYQRKKERARGVSIPFESTKFFGDTRQCRK